MNAVKITFKHNVVRTTQDLSITADFIVLFRLQVIKKCNVNLPTARPARIASTFLNAQCKDKQIRPFLHV